MFPGHPLLLLIPGLALVLAATVEAGMLIRRGQRYDWKSYGVSLVDMLGRGFVHRLLGGGIAALLLYAVSRVRMAEWAMDRAWQWGALIVGQEFCYYWMHRAGHRVRWFWLNHAVHHSPSDYTLAAAYRLGWSSPVTGAALFFAPLVLLGFPVPYVLAALGLNLFFQFWLHTELIGRLPGWVEYVFNTPAHHRIHHASNPEYLDCNYGGMLIVFDRLFGSFRAGVSGVPPRYGLTDPVRGHNPLRVEFHAWIGMFAALRRAHGPGAVLRVLFGPPGVACPMPVRHIAVTRTAQAPVQRPAGVVGAGAAAEQDGGGREWPRPD